MQYRDFEVQTITGFIELPCQNSKGADLRRTNDASNFARQIEKTFTNLKDVCVFVEETTASIQFTLKSPSSFNGEATCRSIGQQIVSMFVQFTEVRNPMRDMKAGWVLTSPKDR